MKYISSSSILLSIFCVISLSTYAQDFPSEYWHKGKAVLMNEDTIFGNIKYDLQNDLIQIETKNSIKTYSSRKIFYFEIFDQTINNYRHFYSLPFQMQPNYEVPILFEVLYEGKLSLLCREQIVTETVQPYNYNAYYYSPSYGGTRNVLTYNFYFLDESGTITYYTMKKNDLLRFFKRKQQEMKQYIKKNNLKHDRMRDLVRITAYYNALLDA